ncbi:MAG: hypothetical protein HY270_03975 [Deltaproteobacteria bacterium]|nr:hypothetical protein [Deltaproteobacteria bacterium]
MKRRFVRPVGSAYRLSSLQASSRYNLPMPADQLIALEAAIAEIGGLYSVACSFAVLRQRAEAELLPQISALSSRLRSLLRQNNLSEAEVDKAAHEIVAVGSIWRQALDEVRRSEVYQRGLAAYAAGRQDELREIIPAIYAGLRADSPGRVCLPFAPANPGRRSGQGPFLNAADCAEAILSKLETGAQASSGGEWWERELAAVEASDSPEGVETPIWLEIAGSDLKVAVFRVEVLGSLRIFTPRLQTAMRVGLRREADDEWWQAYDESYDKFRHGLVRELRLRRVPLVEDD